jgi:peroxiredoxin
MKMNRILTALTLTAAATLAPAAVRADAVVGRPAPTFSLADLDGKTYKLEDLKGKVVVLEWMNPNCPFSRRHSDAKTMISTSARHGDVVWLAINSTAKNHPDFLEPAAYKTFLSKHDIKYPVLYDTSGDVGHAYGADTTPDMFVIDERGTLIYAGAIDDDPSGRKGAPTNYVEAALTQHASGQPIAVATNKSYGCSVKYN